MATAIVYSDECWLSRDGGLVSDEANGQEAGVVSSGGGFHF